MEKRFEGLDRFLPPPPASESRTTSEDTEPTRGPSRRARAASTRVRRAVRVGVSFLAVAVALTSVALAVASLPAAPAAVSDGPPPATDADVSLGAAGTGEVEEQRRDGTRTRRSSKRRAPRRVRHRLQLAPRAPRRRATTALPPVAAPEPDQPKSQSARRSRSHRAVPAPPPPAPPQTPLFHCVSGPGNEHYVTIDRARAGQLSSPNSGWRCSVVGQVYQEPGPGRAAIELDDGTAYVLERREKTEPSSELLPLYRHWVSYDWYYSARPADGGLVGYIAA